MERTFKNYSSSYLSLLFLLFRFSIIFFIFTTNVSCDNTNTQALMYLAQYGYINPAVRNGQSGHIMTEDAMTKAIEEFQSFAGLNMTGTLDRDTINMMKMPRCGVKDKVGFAISSRSKRYATQGSRWRVKDLTYKISKYSQSGLKKSEVDEEIRRAFSVWEQVTPLTFTKKSGGPVHIEVRFERGEHGDGDPFDGPGGTLAHAFFPIFGGDTHFDDAEKWIVNSSRGTSLFMVAAHEFGHSLGLSHSDVRTSLMAPFYKGYQPFFTLDDDDIQGIQALYGKPKRDSDGEGTENKPSTPDTPGEEDGEGELCTDAKIDTIFNSAEGVTYAFKGEYYWKLTEDSIAPGYPRYISRSWIGLPSDIDAAFTYKNGKTYFFKGSEYWRYTGKRMDGSYPKQISEGFTGIPNNIDAAMVWSGNGKIYFFKGSKFWRFDPTQVPTVKSSYPRPISNWEGIPDNVDAALHYTNGYTYFFKGGSYYRFNDRNFAVDVADPPFPRNAGYWWFGCRSASKGALSEKNDYNRDSVNSQSTLTENLELSKPQSVDRDFVSDIIQDADPSGTGVDKDDRPFIKGTRVDRNNAGYHMNSSRVSTLVISILFTAVIRLIT